MLAVRPDRFGSQTTKKDSCDVVEALRLGKAPRIAGLPTSANQPLASCQVSPPPPRTPQLGPFRNQAGAFSQSPGPLATGGPNNNASEPGLLITELLIPPVTSPLMQLEFTAIRHQTSFYLQTKHQSSSWIQSPAHSSKGPRGRKRHTNIVGASALVLTAASGASISFGRCNSWCRPTSYTDLPSRMERWTRQPCQRYPS